MRCTADDRNRPRRLRTRSLITCQLCSAGGIFAVMPNAASTSSSARRRDRRRHRVDVVDVARLIWRFALQNRPSLRSSLGFRGRCGWHVRLDADRTQLLHRVRRLCLIHRHLECTAKASGECRRRDRASFLSWRIASKNGRPSMSPIAASRPARNRIVVTTARIP